MTFEPFPPSVYPQLLDSNASLPDAEMPWIANAAEWNDLKAAIFAVQAIVGTLTDGWPLDGSGIPKSIAQILADHGFA